MSTRSLIELNHDYDWEEFDLQEFRRNADDESLPPYATYFGSRHHADKNRVELAEEACDVLRSAMTELLPLVKGDPSAKKIIKKALDETWRYDEKLSYQG